jgi:integrase
MVQPTAHAKEQAEHRSRADARATRGNASQSFAALVSEFEPAAFCNRRGNPYSENKVVQKRLWPILDDLEIPRCGMHAFRHAHATLSLATGASPKTVQEQLRHADPMTTMRMYVHVVGGDQRRAAEKVAEILRPNAAKSEVKPLLLN